MVGMRVTTIDSMVGTVIAENNDFIIVKFDNGSYESLYPWEVFIES